MNPITEAEAAKLVCPFNLQRGPSGGGWNLQRDGCIGSKCMLWCKHDEQPTTTRTLEASDYRQYFVAPDHVHLDFGDRQAAAIANERAVKDAVLKFIAVTYPDRSDIRSEFGDRRFQVVLHIPSDEQVGSCGAAR